MKITLKVPVPAKDAAEEQLKFLGRVIDQLHEALDERGYVFKAVEIEWTRTR